MILQIRWRRWLFSTLLCWAGTVARVTAVEAGNGTVPPTPFVVTADQMTVDPAQGRTVAGPAKDGRRAVVLKSEVPDPVAGRPDRPTFTVTLRDRPPGIYRIFISARTADPGHDRLLLGIDERPLRRRRVIFYSGNIFRCDLTKLELTNGEHRLAFYLPPGMEVYQLEFRPWQPPVVPEAARCYQPPVTPGARPRVLVNPERLAVIRKYLEHPENRDVWETVRQHAQKPHDPGIGPYGVDTISAETLLRIREKAFYYLVTGDRRIGREALTLARNYLEAVDPGIQQEFR